MSPRPLDLETDEQTNADRTLRLVLAGAALVFAAISVRNLFVPVGNWWIDPLNLALVLAGIAVLRRWPRTRHLVSRGLLVTFGGNVLVSMTPWDGPAFTPTHVLLPLLVLYGVLLHDELITSMTALGVLGFIAYTASRAPVLAARDVLLLTNVALTTIAIAIFAFRVNALHRRMMRRMHQRGQELEQQLLANRRLTATIFHDIANPLTALRMQFELAGEDGTLSREELDLSVRAAARIAGIIDVVREIDRTGVSSAALSTAAVTVSSLMGEIEEVFAARLDAKGLRLELLEGGSLAVRTNVTITCHSVLANFVSNAIKFSPRGSRIAVSARHDGATVRISVRDRGAGFTAAALREHAEPTRTLLTSTAGTEAEHGHGVGLHIAGHYLRALGGSLEVANAPDGGGMVTAVLPRAASA